MSITDLNSNTNAAIDRYYRGANRDKIPLAKQQIVDLVNQLLFHKSLKLEETGSKIIPLEKRIAWIKIEIEYLEKKAEYEEPKYSVENALPQLVSTITLTEGVETASEKKSETQR